MPFLMHIVIQCLGSTNADMRETAGRTLGELVERLADKIIPTVLPTLTMNKDTSVASRQGACLGLKYLVSASQKAQLVLYQDSLTAAVGKNLLDPVESVREAAAEAFSEVFEKCGQKVMNQVLDTLLDAAATTPAAEDSLQRIATIDPDKIVVAVVPKLLQVHPVPDWAKRCLAAIAGPAGFHFSRQLSTVMPVLAQDSKGSEESAKTALAIAMATPEEAMYLLVDTLVDLTRENDPSIIVFALNLIGAFTNQHEHGTLDDYVVRFIEIVMNLYLDKRETVLDAACNSMKLLLESVVSASEEKYIKAVRTAIQAVRFSQVKQGVDVGNVPGFNRPAGLAPVLVLLKQGVMGAAEIKEQSAVTIGEVLRLCTPESITSSAVMQLAPIIRVLSEKVEPGVKKAILSTLNVLLELVPNLVKALVPQFQVVFTRSLQDADLPVREEAAVALGRLMALNPRVDPLVNELCTSILASPSKIRHSMLAALVKVLEHAGTKLSDKGQERVLACLDQLRDDVSCNADERTRELTALGFGALCAVVPPEQVTKLVMIAVAGGKSKEENLRDVNFQTLARVPAALKYGAVLDPVLDAVLSLLSNPVDSIVLWKSKNEALYQWALVSLRACPENVPEVVRSMVASLVATDDREIRVAALKLIKELAKIPAALTPNLLAVCVPRVLELALDKKSFPVKIASERALMHLLCVKKDGGKSVVVEYVKKCDEAFRKDIQGYITRVLSKLNDSDQEGNE
jgi:HEAT repeat protein